MTRAPIVIFSRQFLLRTVCPFGMAHVFSMPALAQNADSSALTNPGPGVSANQPATNAGSGIPKDTGAGVPASEAANGQPKAKPKPVNATSSSLTGSKTENITVIRQRLLMKERNVPSTAFELSEKDVQSVGPSGSIQSVLK
jgi:hypothetical protein